MYVQYKFSYFFLYFRLKLKGQFIEDFTYNNKEIMEEIYGAMNSTNFLGVSVSLRAVLREKDLIRLLP